MPKSPDDQRQRAATVLNVAGLIDTGHSSPYTPRHGTKRERWERKWQCEQPVYDWLLRVSFYHFVGLVRTDRTFGCKMQMVIHPRWQYRHGVHSCDPFVGMVLVISLEEGTGHESLKKYPYDHDGLLRQKGLAFHSCEARITFRIVKRASDNLDVTVQ